MAYGPSGFAKNTATANYLSGRQAADEEHQANQLSRARDQSYQQNETAANDQQQQKAAQQLYLASQYALQQPAGQTKAFVEQNFPDLVTHAGAKWATATEDDVRSELEGARAQFGAQSGVGPTPAPVRLNTKTGPRGSVIQEDPTTGKLTQVVGPDNSQPAAGGGPPSGYRFRKDGGLEPIPGGPADPAVTPKTNPTRVFQQADKLRDEFNAASKDFISVGDSFNTVRAAAKDPTAAGDLSLIFAYMKMLDPNSVVREQEFANAQNAAGIPVQIQNQWNKLLNGERLSEPQRNDFIKQAEKVYKVRKTRNEGVVDRYTKIAQRFGVNPQDVVGDLGVYEEPQAPAAPGSSPNTPAPAAPAKRLTPEQASALPPGTPFVGMDGVPRVRH